MLPALARNAINTYTDPGDLVVDSNCGTGNALVEAVRLDRDAIGVERNPRRSAIAAARLTAARSDGAPGRFRVLDGDGRDLLRILTRKDARSLRESVGQVARLPHASADLVLTTLPTGGRSGLEPHVAAAAAAVQPGRFVVLVIDARRAGTALVGEVVELCQGVGLLYWQHVIALIAEIRGDRLSMRCSLRAHSGGSRSHMTCHEDVLVFRRPANKEVTV